MKFSDYLESRNYCPSSQDWCRETLSANPQKSFAKEVQFIFENCPNAGWLQFWIWRESYNTWRALQDLFILEKIGEGKGLGWLNCNATSKPEVNKIALRFIRDHVKITALGTKISFTLKETK